MKLYAIVDSGGFVQYTNAVDDFVVLVPPPGMTAVELSAAIPKNPSGGHLRYHLATQTWVDARSLDEVKHAKWQQIKLARSAAESGGFTWDGSTFDSDSDAQRRISGAVTLAGLSPEFSIDWTLADNTTRALGAADMVAVGVALGAHVNAQHAAGRALRQQIDEATTAEQVESVHW